MRNVLLLVVALVAAVGTRAEAAEVSGSLTCGVGYVCTIALPSNSSIKGDPFMFGACRAGSERKSGCLWQVDWTERGSRNPMVVLTPNFDSLKTNILIETDRAVYDVDLRSDSRAGRASVAFTDGGNVHNEAGARVTASTSSTAADDANTRESAAAAPSAGDVLRVAQTANPDPRWEYWNPDYCATETGHPDFKPIFVVNDGARTIVAMPYWMHATPSVFGFIDGQRVLEQPAKIGRMWIFDGAPTQFELAVGDATVMEHQGHC